MIISLPLVLLTNRLRLIALELHSGSVSRRNRKVAYASGAPDLQPLRTSQQIGPGFRLHRLGQQKMFSAQCWSKGLCGPMQRYR